LNGGNVIRISLLGEKASSKKIEEAFLFLNIGSHQESLGNWTASIN
jgi:hypothetical protein